MKGSRFTTWGLSALEQHKSTCVIPRHYTYVKKRIPIPEGQLAIEFERPAVVVTPEVMKTCSKCGVAKGLDGFARRSEVTTRNHCKVCRNSYVRSRYVSETKKFIDPSIIKVCSTCGVEKTAALFRKGRNQCKACRAVVVNANSRKWYKNNVELVNSRTREWKKSHAEKVNASCRKWAKNNPEKKKAGVRKWQSDNPERVKVYAAKSHAKRKGAGPTHGADWHYVRDHWQDKCAYCGHKCVGKGALHFDHIVPVVSGGTNSLNNLTIACKHCNSSKSDKEVFTWWKASGHWDPVREAKLRAHMESNVKHTDEDEFAA